MGSKFYHWIVGIAIIFAVLYVWKSQLLKGVPVLGPYLSA